MSIRALTPMLRTWMLDESIAFYTDVLDFRCDARAEGWASLSRDGVTLMLSAPNDHLAEHAAAFTGSLYFRTDDVDERWARLKDRARVCYALETFAYGMREFAIYDNNGYVLQFGQPVAAAMQRP